jgi:hypothetical protein
MSISWKRVLLVTAICLAVGFGFSVVDAIFDFSMETVHINFQLEWITATAWARFFSYLPVLQAWALLISFSVLPVTASRASDSIAAGVQAVTPAIVLVVVLTVGYVVVMATADPSAVRRAQSLEYTSALARSVLGQGEAALESASESGREVQDRREQLTQAIDAFQTYLSLVGEDAQAAELLEDAENRRTFLRSPDVADTVAPEEEPEDGPSAEAYLDRAKAAMRDGDYVTAHYRATLAARLDPEGEAALIAQSALERLQQGGSPAERAQQTLFDRKVAAKEALSGGDLVEAYYLFAQLHQEHPRDVDVSRYYALVSDAVTEEAVFFDDVGEALLLPGWHDVVFANIRTDDAHELVYLGKLVVAPTGMYARDIEVVRFSPEGRFLYHFAATYGKLEDGHLIMQVLDPEDPDAVSLPGYYIGRERVSVPHILELSVSESALISIAAGSHDLRAVGVDRLTGLPAVLTQHGLFQVPVHHEMLRRLALPFLFAITAFVAIGFAWRNRSRYLSRPPIAAFLLVPFMPFALHPLYELFAYAHELLTAWMVLAVGFIVALVILVAAEVVLLVVSLAYLAIALSS